MGQAGIFAFLFFLWISWEVLGITTEITTTDEAITSPLTTSDARTTARSPTTYAGVFESTTAIGAESTIDIAMDVPNQTAIMSETTNEESSQEAYTSDTTEYETTIQTATTDYDGCLSNPCLNHGSCYSDASDYICVCTPGYTGINCETGITTDITTTDEAIATPFTTSDAHTTACSPTTYADVFESTTGITTEIIDEAITSPLTTSDSHTTARSSTTDADVFESTTGITTEIIDEAITSLTTSDARTTAHLSTTTYADVFESTTEYNECSSSPCINGATCVDDIDGYSCNCSSGWDGIHCEIEYNECSSSPCLNGATCVDDINGYFCNCSSGWGGIHCEIDYDECSSSPCLNGATCVDDINGYICNCTSGWDGIHCETDIDECVSSPCQNEGTCTDGIDGYICSCDSGWNGTYCELDINECPDVECHNGGSCTNLPGTFACICPEDFAGEFCEDQIKFDPVIGNVYPLFGPIAGGTIVNITGQHFISARVMKLGDIECDIIDENLDENWIVAKTPPATPTDIGRPLIVIVVFFGGLEIPAHADYRYRPNPKIEAIYPLETISRGGTKLTVNGTHMDSVAEPVLEVTLEIRIIAENETAPNITKLPFSGGECDIDSPTHLHCIVPPIETDILQNATCGAEKIKQPCIEPKLFVGMIMDDVPDFKNISDHENLTEYGLLTVFDPPTFSDDTKEQSFEYKKGSPIVIQGHNLLRGLTADDYSVKVGEMNGTQLTVADNAISFHPPTIDKLFFTTQTLEIVVNVGTNYPNYVGNVEYKTILLIVVLCAGVVGLIIIIVPPSVVYHRKKKKIKAKTDDKNVVVFDGDIIHLPPIAVDDSMDGTDDIRMPYVRNDLQEHAFHPQQDNPMFNPSMFSSFTPIPRVTLDKGSSNDHPIKPNV